MKSRDVNAVVKQQLTSGTRTAGFSSLDDGAFISVVAALKKNKKKTIK